MPKTTFHEYRPGRWVKLVDGKAVGPATAEEVAQWRQEQAEQATIWRDVLKEAAEAAPARDQPAAAGRRKGEAVRADDSGIWQDVVGQVEGPRTQPAAPVEPPEPEPPLRTLEEALRSARRGKPVTVQSGRVVSSGKRAAPAGPSGLPEAKPMPAEQLAEPAPGLTQTPPRPARATPVKQAAKPAPQSEIKPTQESVKAPLERPLATSVQDTVHSGPVLVADTSVAKTTVKPARKRTKAGVAREEAQPKPAVEAKSAKQPRPADRQAKGVAPQRVAEVEPSAVAGIRAVEHPPKPARKRAKAAAPEEVAEREALPQIEAVPASEPAKPAPEPAKPARQQVGAEPALVETVMEADEGEAEGPQAEVSVIHPRKTTRRRGAAASRRRKAVPAQSMDRLGPAYLWIMVGAADDVVTAVRGGLARYEERFGERAGAVLCHAEDLPALDGAKLPVDVRPRKGVPRRNFWIGPK